MRCWFSISHNVKISEVAKQFGCSVAEPDIGSCRMYCSFALYKIFLGNWGKSGVLTSPILDANFFVDYGLVWSLLTIRKPSFLLHSSKYDPGRQSLFLTKLAELGRFKSESCCLMSGLIDGLCIDSTSCFSVVQFPKNIL